MPSSTVHHPRPEIPGWLLLNSPLPILAFRVFTFLWLDLNTRVWHVLSGVGCHQATAGAAGSAEDGGKEAKRPPRHEAVRKHGLPSASANELCFSRSK